MSWLLIVLLALLGLGLLIGLAGVILAKHKGAWIFLAVLCTIALFLLLLWPGWARGNVAVWWASWHIPTSAAKCTNLGNMVERDIAPDGKNALVCGPAIAEAPGMVWKVNAGQTVYIVGIGSWWSFGSQASLDSRWPSHLREFLVKCEADGWSCVVNGPKPESKNAAPIYAGAAITTELPAEDTLIPIAKPGTSCNLPCRVTGPAIIEYDGGLAKLDTLVVFDFKVKGVAWGFPTQAALDARWPSHLAEWQAKYPNLRPGLPTK